MGWGASNKPSFLGEDGPEFHHARSKNWEAAMFREIYSILLAYPQPETLLFIRDSF